MKSEQTIVFFHGMGRSKYFFKPMEWYMRHKGFNVVNLSYPSTRHDISTLAKNYGQPVIQQAAESSKSISIVTHSLGGIVARTSLKAFKPQNLNCVIMLAPPNNGSHVSDRIKHWRLYQTLFGGPGGQLTTDSDFLKSLGPVDYKTLIVAGKRSLLPFMSYFFKDEAHDTLVSVESTKVEGMSDFVLTSSCHATIGHNPKVWDLAHHYVQGNPVESLVLPSAKIVKIPS